MVYIKSLSKIDQKHTIIITYRNHLGYSSLIVKFTEEISMISSTSNSFMGLLFLNILIEKTAPRPNKKTCCILPWLYRSLDGSMGTKNLE